MGSKKKPSREEELFKVTFEVMKFLTKQIAKHKLKPLEILGILSFLEWTAIYALVNALDSLRKLREKLKYVG